MGRTLGDDVDEDELTRRGYSALQPPVAFWTGAYGSAAGVCKAQSFVFAGVVDAMLSDKIVIENQGASCVAVDRGSTKHGNALKATSLSLSWDISNKTIGIPGGNT